MQDLRNWFNMEDIILLYKSRKISLKEANTRADNRRTIIVVVMAAVLISIITIGVA